MNGGMVLPDPFLVEYGWISRSSIQMPGSYFKGVASCILATIWMTSCFTLSAMDSGSMHEWIGRDGPEYCMRMTMIDR